MTRRLAWSANRRRHGHPLPHRSVLGMVWAAVLVFTTASVSTAPSVVADPSDSLRAAVMAARGASCGPLRSDQMVEQTAEEVNQSTDRWIDHAARAAPVPDALPVLRDLGYGGSKAAMLFGAGKTDGDSIKALLLQGYLKIPDCSYTDYGASTLHNKSKDLILTTIVLAA